MSNILIFLIHFSIISHFKRSIAIKNKIHNERISNYSCYILNRNLYNNTSTHYSNVSKLDKIKLNNVKNDINELDEVKRSEILVESTNGGLKSIVDNGSIKSSSIRHEILDKESLLDDLIVSNDIIEEVLEDESEEIPVPLSNLKYNRTKFDEEFKELESSVLKKSVDKKEQIIKPSDKAFKRRSKETIYTRLQNYVKSSEPMLAKHGLLDEAKNFVHLFHWNVWHTMSKEHELECNWTSDQFDQFNRLIEGIDKIINDELKSYLEITTSTDQDLLTDVVEQRTSCLFSSNNIYKRVKSHIDMEEFYVYRERMKNIYTLNCKINKIVRSIKSIFTEYRNWVIYRKVKHKMYDLGRKMERIKSKIIFKLSKSRILGGILRRNVEESDIPEQGYGINGRYKIQLDRLNIQQLLIDLSHSYLSRQNLRHIEDINRKVLYNNLSNGNWSLYFVGSGSRQPTSTRLTSTMAFRRRDKPSSIWLFDCGEGTKNALESLGLDPCQVERIFLTHLHGDHCYGIFSFLYLRERAKPLEIYGPPGTRRLINSIHQNTSTSTHSHFTIHELLPKPGPNGGKTAATATSNGTVNGGNGLLDDIYINKDEYYNVYEEDDVQIVGAPLEHTMPTVGYVIRKAVKANNSNHNGHSVIDPYLNGSESGFYKPRYHRSFNAQSQEKKIVICQDSSDSSKMEKIARDADVLVHEATLSSTTSRVSGILVDLVKHDNSVVLCKGAIRNLYKFLSNIEVKLGCFNFTLSALTSFVKCERYYMLQKLNVLKNFIETFKPLNKEENKIEIRENYSKKEREKELKEKWLNKVFIFMDRLNGLNELNKYEYFVKRLQNRYKLMEKLCKVLPTMDLTDILETTSRNFVFSRIVEGHNPINDSYVEFNIKSKYDESNFVEMMDYLNSISRDIYEYWTEILQIPKSTESENTAVDSSESNWTMLYNRIIGSFGHSTPNMAGRFASRINAKKLILTHFSNRYPGDEKFENLLTMIRMENEARLGYSRDGNKTIPVIAAWDALRINL